MSGKFRRFVISTKLHKWMDNILVESSLERNIIILRESGFSSSMKHESTHQMFFFSNLL